MEMKHQRIIAVFSHLLDKLFKYSLKTFLKTAGVITMIDRSVDTMKSDYFNVKSTVSRAG